MNHKEISWSQKKRERELSQLGAGLADALDALQRAQHFAQQAETALVQVQLQVERAYVYLDEDKKTLE